jgi:hypothetical protein
MDYLPFLMLPVAFVLMFLGVQVAFSMMITAVLFGLAIFGNRVIFQFIEKMEDISSNFVFAAVPLFVFMGAMLEKSGIADKLFEAIHIWTRRLPGGLALATVIMCIFFAASSGVIGATESVVGLLTIPIMLRYGYDKPLISGTICAGGSLGTIIPPSVVAVVMGPLANQSVGDLLYGMVFPGLNGWAIPRVHLPLCRFASGRIARTRRVDRGETLTTRNMVPPVFDLRGARLDPARLGLADGGGGGRSALLGAAHDALRALQLERAVRGADQDAEDHRHDHDRAPRRNALHRRVHRRRRNQHRESADREDGALALDAARPDDADHLHRRLLPGLDLDRPHLRAAVHAARDPGRLRSGVVLRPVPGDDPDELPHAADGAGDLLSARGGPGGSPSGMYRGVVPFIALQCSRS